MTSRRVFQRVRDLVAWGARDRDIHDEMQFHVESLARQYMADGMPEADARLAARRQFGSPLQMREQGHGVRGAGVVEDLVREIRHATRRLVRTPGFTLAAVLTLALAIGANASVFTIVHRVVLNPLPYPESDRLIEVDHGVVKLNIMNGMGVTPGLYFHYEDRARTLDAIAAYGVRDTTLTGAGEPERLQATYTTPSLAGVLRVSPALGRWFTPADAVRGARRVVVISHGFWMERFGGDPDVIGRSVALDGASADIVGVMPRSFAFPDPQVDLWLAEPLRRADGFGLWSHQAIARLHEDATLADARAETRALVADIPQAFPGDTVARGIFQTEVIANLRPLKDATLGTVARALWILLASVGLVLFVACANVANLFLVRVDARQREIAVRSALGASRRGVAAVFLAESTLLSIAGGVIGLAFAWAAVRLLLVVAPSNLPRLEEVRLDAISLLFTFGLSALSAVVFGAVPVVHRRMPAAVLLEGGRGQTAGARQHRARRVLIGAQIALALVLLVTSGLMVRSVQALRAVDPGFDAAPALTFTVGLPERAYPNRAAGVAAHQAIADRLSALPGVMSVGATTCLPLSGGCSGNTMLAEGRPLPPRTVPPVALSRAVTAGYFESMGIPLIRGRTLTRDEVDRGEPAVVVSETFARTFFLNEDPIGRRVASNLPPPRPGERPTLAWLTIVGVVSDTPIGSPGEPFRLSHLYMPMSIAGGPDIPTLVGPNIAVMHYVVRTAIAPLALSGSVREAVRAVDPQLAVSQLRLLQHLLDRSLAHTTFTMVLLVMAAAMALMLGVIGIYAVISYIVSQRTSEIGVRLALGADPGGIARLIVRQGGTVAIAGVTVGLVAALAGGRLIESVLYGVSPRDPGVLAITTIALLGVALVACWLPARRAAAVSPMEALRAE